MPNLRIVATGSAGYDHIDVSAASQRDIAVCNVAQYGPAVAEFNMALMLSLSRKLHTAHENTLRQDFSIAELLGRNLFGRTLGIIGTGHIGANVAKLARTFGMHVVAYDPLPKVDLNIHYVTLNALLRQAEVISICCPLNSVTKHMIGDPEFNLMRRGVLIVNTSRGAIIDTQALVRALEQGIVAGAALDVLEAETVLPKGDLVRALSGRAEGDQSNAIAGDLKLLSHPKVLVTPHVAYYTEDSLDAIRKQTAASLAAFSAGRLESVVNSSALVR